MTNSDKEISNELTREERANLASSPCFGLYMMPAYLADAKTSGELCDIDCALDNALVPRLRDQLSEDHLSMMKRTGDLSHAWIPSTMKDIHERIKSRVRLPEPKMVLIMGRKTSYITYDREPRKYAVALSSRQDKGLELSVVEARGKVEATLMHPTVARYVSAYGRRGTSFSVVEDVLMYLHTCPPFDGGGDESNANGQDFRLTVVEADDTKGWAVAVMTGASEGEDNRSPIVVRFVDAEGDLEAAFAADVLIFQDDAERAEALASYDDLEQLIDVFAHGDGDLAIVDMNGLIHPPKEQTP